MNKLLCSPPLISLISLKTILLFTTFFLALRLFFLSLAFGKKHFFFVPCAEQTFRE